MNLLLIAAVLLIGLAPAIAEEPRIKSPEISSDNSPEAIARAKQQGTETALADIKAGHPVILYFGIPWPANKPRVDDVTGLPVEMAGGCTFSAVFSAEVNAYNDTVRAWHAKKKAAAPAEYNSSEITFKDGVLVAAPGLPPGTEVKNPQTGEIWIVEAGGKLTPKSQKTK
jgi:hypothetical protein